ncbi:MAG: MCE family protein [Gemmatimonadales bacterium]|nr:MCE family protein [Gemmatimonadales bacterium]
MKKRSNDWIVGVVIIGAMVGIVAATLYLQQADIGSKRSDVSARFRDVGNLQVGNTVVIRGVRAGRVEQISLAPAGWVAVRLNLDEGIELPADPVVLIQAATLFGEWQATITPRDAVPANRDVQLALAEAADAPPATLPGAVLPDIAQLTTVAGGIAGNVASVAERVRTAFTDSAALELRASIRNFSALSNDLARAVRVQSRNLDSIAVGVRAGVADVSLASASLRRTVARADSATSSGELQAILTDAAGTAATLREASTRLNALAQSMESAEQRLRSVVSKADSVLGKVDRGEGSLGLLVNDPSLYRNSDSLMVDLRALLADFRKDPKRYFSFRVF